MVHLVYQFRALQTVNVYKTLRKWRTILGEITLPLSCCHRNKSMSVSTCLRSAFDPRPDNTEASSWSGNLRLIRVAADLLLAVCSSKNAQIKPKCFKPWRQNTALLLSSQQASFREVSQVIKKKDKILSPLYRLENGKTTCWKPTRGKG